MVTCKHAANGCGYPQGECSGACMADKPQHQTAAPHYLTVVYRITKPGQPRDILDRYDWTASSHTHAIRERDRLQAENADILDQCTQSLLVISTLNDEIGRLTAQRDELLEALRITRGNIASLGPAGAIEPYACYLEWLAMVDAAIAKAGGAA